MSSNPTPPRTPVVRPFGYVEDGPVVRKIGDRDLYLGNVHAADCSRHGYEFAYVLSLTEDECPSTTHHCPLVDGSGNDWRLFKAAVDTARDLSRRDGSTLIHCKAGISRSSTIIATLIATAECTSFGEALSEVQSARPFAIPHPALHELAVVYLAV